MANILTIEQVRKALYLDDDAEVEELEEYSRIASSFIKQKTGYDFAQDEEIEPLAIQCAKLYVRQMYFGNGGSNRDHDYSLGIEGLIVDLQIIAKRKLSEVALE